MQTYFKNFFDSSDIFFILISCSHLASSALCGAALGRGELFVRYHRHFYIIFKVKFCEKGLNILCKTSLYCVSHAYFPQTYALFRKMPPQPLIRLRSDDWNACKPSRHVVRGASESAAPPTFPSLLLFLREQFSPFFFPQVPPGLICIIQYLPNPQRATMA